MTQWPDYCKRETLAKRLDIAPGAVDQLVKRGLLPAAVKLGEAKLWRWSDVDAWISSRVGDKTPASDVDPYATGVHNAAPISVDTAA